ncbi:MULTISPECIES: DsbA family protein [unclassified Mesorhizobium]|uniref:DsbA family protein n=1 Tax=unclassified Mesorhizobium TaxID=325217 RepID=UPI00296259FE|nr:MULTISPECIES: DsbA family protein [unclassified Mesorhizobium]
MSRPAASRTSRQASRKRGQEPEPILREADSDAAKADLAAATEQAKTLGIFGSPSFLVDGELFWGDDRLDDAMRWLRQIESGPPD